MKKTILISAFSILAFSAFAQKSSSSASKLKFSIGVDAGFPVGDYSPYTSFAYGGSAQAEYAFSEKASGTFSVGYLGFSGKNGFSVDGFIPVLVGGRINFSEKVYGSAQVGLYLSTASGGGSAFAFAPGVGFKVSENFDILAKYQSATKDGVDVSFVGVRAAYSF